MKVEILLLFLNNEYKFLGCEFLHLQHMSQVNKDVMRNKKQVQDSFFSVNYTYIL